MKYFKLHYLLIVIGLSACENRPVSNIMDMQEVDMEVADAFYEDMEVAANDFTVPATMMSPPPPPAENYSQKLIKTGRIKFESEDAATDYNILRNSLANKNAYIEHETQNKTDYQISYDITIRVPSKNYDSLYTSIIKLTDNIKSKSSTIEDVTERYYDLKTRIKNKEALEERYKNILSKASKVKDLLEIEKSLNEVRTDIERMQGQFNYLSKQISYSTIYINFYETLPYTYDGSQRAGFGARILTALSSGWQSLLSFTVGIIGIWPYLFILAGFVFVARKGYIKLKTKR